MGDNLYYIPLVNREWMIFNSIDQEIKRIEHLISKEPERNDSHILMINTLEALKQSREVIGRDLENVDISNILGSKDQVIRLLITQNNRLKNKNKTYRNRITTLLERLSFIRNQKEA